MLTCTHSTNCRVGIHHKLPHMVPDSGIDAPPSHQRKHTLHTPIHRTDNYHHSHRNRHTDYLASRNADTHDRNTRRYNCKRLHQSYYVFDTFRRFDMDFGCTTADHRHCSAPPPQMFRIDHRQNVVDIHIAFGRYRSCTRHRSGKPSNMSPIDILYPKIQHNICNAEC